MSKKGWKETVNKDIYLDWPHQFILSEVEGQSPHVQPRAVGG